MNAGGSAHYRWRAVELKAEDGGQAQAPYVYPLWPNAFLHWALQDALPLPLPLPPPMLTHRRPLEPEPPGRLGERALGERRRASLWRVWQGGARARARARARGRWCWTSGVAAAGTPSSSPGNLLRGGPSLRLSGG
jgi:hypothetical protein